MFMNGFCGGELLSVTLRHNERGKTLPYMGIPARLSYFLISLQYGLALYDAHIWRSSATRGQWGHFWKSKHSLREWESFQRREERSQECHRSGPTMGGSCFRGSGHILGSFPSYFIHNGLRRTEILESSSANIWKIFCSSKRPRSLLGKSTTAEYKKVSPGPFETSPCILKSNDI